MSFEITNKKLLSQNMIKNMLRKVEEYEAIKNKTSTKFKWVKDFCAHYGFAHQNFMKVYKRFVASGRNPEALLPQKRGPKVGWNKISPKIEKRVIELRKLGENRYAIAEMIAQEELGKISPSSVYNVCRRHGLNRLSEKEKEEKRKIISKTVGELAHSDLYQVPRGTILSHPNKTFYIFGIIDGCSRTVWLVLLPDKKALSATKALLISVGVLNMLYGIKFKAMLTDNGAEFGSGRFAKNKDTHSFEVFLKDLGIKLKEAKPYRPQTNGKIERFWLSSFRGDFTRDNL